MKDLTNVTVKLEAGEAAALFGGQDIHDVIVRVEDAESGRTLWTNLYYVDTKGQRVAFVEYGEDEEEGGLYVYEVTGNELVRSHTASESAPEFSRVQLY
ncbi:hypothetical protein EVJ32_04625 [Exiguobacterium sp. SH5S4]|uniref:hypothetical protein n=1 Tax=Exiguobacterium sp. SH5S4 TaxID=2510961 RepID=UPI001039F4F4|nr:hypothetical protein [Exiguobacterium sp. SH5S4]TCI26662.1 hypothetical protein EVJ32_04625 [Exiguobacterium sp. SH5S4]